MKSIRIGLIIAWISLLFPVLAGCSPIVELPIEEPLYGPEVNEIVSETVSASEGGTVSVTNEESDSFASLELDFPPSALEEDEEITIGHVVGGDLPPPPEDYVPVGPRLSFGPSGISFKKSATIRFPSNWSQERYENAKLMKYDESSGEWIEYSTHIESGRRVAEIDSFSFWNWIRFWKPNNPASEQKIRNEAENWAPSLDKDELQTRLQKEYSHGITFQQAIGSLLLSEAMWKKIKDGNYYEAVSYTDVVVDVLPGTVLKEIGEKAVGIPTVGITATISSFIIEAALKTFMENVTTSVANAQLQTYLSWRGWFFEDGNWNYNSDLGNSHEAIMGIGYPGPRSDGGWFTYRQLPSGGASWTVGRRANEDPKQLFNLGKQLYQLLDKVVHDDGLSQDRTELREAFEEIGENQPPNASFDASTTNCEASCDITFDASGSSDPDGSIESYLWYIDEGGIKSGETTTHTFDSAGSYTVELVVTDNDGAKDSTTKTISVSSPSNEAPNASFTASTKSGEVPLEVTFDASGSSDPDGSIDSYEWDFDDGSTGSGKTTSHTFDSADNYTVKLTITDNEGGSDSTSMQIDVTSSSGETIEFIKHNDAVTSIAFSPDGDRIASGSEDDTVKVWNSSTGEVVTNFTGHSNTVWTVDFSPDGSKVVSGSHDGTAKVWKSNTGEILTNFKNHSGGVVSVSFSPQGGQVASGSFDDTVKVWNSSTGEVVTNFTGHDTSYSDYVNSVDFSPDGSKVASGESRNEVVKVWNADTGAILTNFTGHSSEVGTVDFSPDGDKVVSAGGPCVGSSECAGTVKVWDAQTGEVLTSFTGHSDYVTSVNFSPDGSKIVSGSYDETVKVWDAQTGEVVKNFKGHSDAVLSVAFSPDGDRIASGSMDETVKVWAWK